jgi:hypothetical protein
MSHKFCPRSRLVGWQEAARVEVCLLGTIISKVCSSTYNCTRSPTHYATHLPLSTHSLISYKHLSRFNPFDADIFSETKNNVSYFHGNVSLRDAAMIILPVNSSPDIIRQVKSRRMRWAGHVARMGEERKV